MNQVLSTSTSTYFNEIKNFLMQKKTFPFFEGSKNSFTKFLFANFSMKKIKPQKKLSHRIMKFECTIIFQPTKFLTLKKDFFR